MATTRSTDPLVWIDCEMTGLDPSQDTILSIACLITDSHLTILSANSQDQGFSTTIHHPAETLSQMSPWCLQTHTSTGLISQCQDRRTSTDPYSAATALLAYIQHSVPEPGRAVLAGNSVHADRTFLMRQPWKMLLDHLHYRILDVSAIKEAVRRWASDEVLEQVPVKVVAHTAVGDVRESLDEARFYMRLFERMSVGVGVGVGVDGDRDVKGQG